MALAGFARRNGLRIGGWNRSLLRARAGGSALDGSSASTKRLGGLPFAVATSRSEIKIANDSFTLEIERLKIAYDLGAAWKSKEIESIEIDGLKLYYDLTGPSTLDYDQLDATIKAGIPFPLDSIKVSNATLDFRTDFGRFAYSASASLERQEPDKIQGSAVVESESESVALQLHAGDRIDFLATINIPWVANSLSKYRTDWIEKLGLSTSPEITMANLSVETTGSLYGISPELIEVAFQSGPISFAAQDLQLQSSPISGSFDFEDNEVRNISPIREHFVWRVYPIQLAPTINRPKP
jgi:hypothetical protein